MEKKSKIVKSKKIMSIFDFVEDNNIFLRIL